MGVLRSVFYFGLGAVIAGSIAYHVGYRNGSLDNALKNIGSSRLERVAEGQYKALNPESGRKYTIDFNKETVTPHDPSVAEKKPLEEIFSQNGPDKN